MAYVSKDSFCYQAYASCIFQEGYSQGLAFALAQLYKYRLVFLCVEGSKQISRDILDACYAPHDPEYHGVNFFHSWALECASIEEASISEASETFLGVLERIER